MILFFFSISRNMFFKGG